MMRAIAAVLFVASVGCAASDGGLDAPPTLEVTSPQRGTQAQGSEVTVTGRVTDDKSGVKVKVAGVEVTPAADGSFSATVPVAAGISILETHAIDSSGNDVRDVRAVLAGTLAATDGSQAAPLAAHVGAQALTKMGNALADTAQAIDFTAAVQSMNPVYNNTGCLGAKIDITSVALSNIDVVLTPKTGALATGVAIDNVEIKLRANFKVACIGGSTTITVRSTKARINGDLGLAVTAGKLAASLPTASVALDGFSVDVGGVPGAIESLLKGEARKAAENALTKVIKDKVPTLANAQLAGLMAKPFDAALLGHDTRITLAPDQLVLSADGLFVALDTKLLVVGGEGGMYLSQPATASAALMPATGLGVAIANDTINQLFAGLWAADALSQDVTLEGPLAVLGGLLDDDARSLQLDVSLPPTVTTDGTALALAVGDMMVSVKDQGGTEIQKLALSLRTTLSAEPTQTGAIALTLGTPELFAQVLAQTDAVDRPLSDAQVEGMVNGAWGLLRGQAETAMSNLPMPALGGVTLGAPSVEGRDGFVVANIPVQ